MVPTEKVGAESSWAARASRQAPHCQGGPRARLNPSASPRSLAKGVQVLPDSATEDFLPFETAAGLASLGHSRLELGSLSYSCQGKTSTELSPS